MCGGNSEEQKCGFLIFAISSLAGDGIPAAAAAVVVWVLEASRTGLEQSGLCRPILRHPGQRLLGYMRKMIRVGYHNSEKVGE